MSRLPQRAWAAPTARSTSSARVTSADLSRSTSATWAPSAESRRAIASPIPRAPPVTSATRPLKLIVSSPVDRRVCRCSRQRLLEIVDQVVRVLEADREPQQILRRPRAGALDRGAVLDQALRPAE